jgi:predicted phosphohydrolase
MMSLYTIGDLHLGFSSDKPMDVFGGEWVNYIDKIKDGWNDIVQEEDTVVIPGDVSWATYLEEAYADFQFIEELNGKKIILKGNHDYWWTTQKKLNQFIREHQFYRIQFLWNNAFTYRDIAICGCRGWKNPLEHDFVKEDLKIYQREVHRLELSLKAIDSKGVRAKYVFMHYPPSDSSYQMTELIEVMQHYDVSRCFFGHVHGKKGFEYPAEEKHNIEFQIVSADVLRFKPLFIV